MITCETGDWYVLKLNDEIYEEGYSIPKSKWLELLEEIGCEVNSIMISDKEMKNGEY